MIKSSKVVVLRCESYDFPKLKNTISKGLDLLGGVRSLFAENDRILLKPNLLSGHSPLKAVTTHPMVFRAIGAILKDNYCNLFYGDSPGKVSMERAAKKSGIFFFARELGILPADFKTRIKISHPDALLAKKLFLAKGVIESDSIINIPKMKTHAFTRITGAVKNLFGCVPGLLKVEFHVKMPDIYQFSKMLVDINTFLKPKLHIMDGITAMEGNGPSGGNPRQMNVLLFSRDPVALDAVFCRLINFSPEHTPTSKIGQEAGLGNYEMDRIQICGDNPDELICKDFKITRKKPPALISRSSFPPFLKNLISPKPVIDKMKCTNCQICIQQCPLSPKALNVPAKSAGKPVFNYKTCIRCYCCQEICPEGAIKVKTPLLGRLIY